MSIQLNYESFGSGRPLILLHGLFGSARNWRSMAKWLSATYQVFTVDIRNHGESPHVDSMYYMEMMEDIKQFMYDRNISKASIVGHSLGGKIAMTFALHYQELLDKLIILDIAPVHYHNDFESLVDAMLTLELNNISNRSHANDSLKTTIEDASLRLFLLQNLSNNSEGFNWRINLPVIKTALADIGAFPDFAQSSRYEGPVLFLAGENSDYILPEHHEDIRTLFPAAEICTLEEAGHWLHADQPQQVFDAISRFLED